ncbi:DUF1853 family protein [Lutibacter citreus]|uniref:DUF1853 family protein n=1 Tax=Lutibacter citreus TaxID=2138210 RepID=UPI000DBE8C04|nr:DUF1853 family protein [Lutibacter citreus]
MNSKNIQLQYEGYFNTPLLWKSINIFGIEQLQLPEIPLNIFNYKQIPNTRLGKRVEQFVFNHLEQIPYIEILKTNIQIQNKTITVGEIDCLLLKNNAPIHLEIVYKFYLYDPKVGNNELDHWIGPNRKDSLVTKLTKLKDKQLPILFKKHTNELLNNLNYEAQDFTQKVIFKAQLFVPLKLKNNSFKEINNDCIYGFYININQLKQFEKCKFYIPSKLNWLLEVQTQTNWINYESFKLQIIKYLEQKTAPLCWLKHPNGTLQKFFTVWW